MKRLLWIGDAACDSGFARCTHGVLETLRHTWDVHVLGLNYRGDPHTYPYLIYPARVGGDIFGVHRLAELVPKISPDLIVVQNDPWNFPGYLAKLASVPVVGFIAVDGKNCAGAGLNSLKHAIFWTEFGRTEAQRGGYVGSSGVIPLGVDLETYRPMDRHEARTALGLPTRLKDAFIIGNVNRNQPRKRLDLTIAFFAEWVRNQRIDDAYLFLHVAPTGDSGYDCQQLSTYYGVPNRLILAEPRVWNGVSERQMATTYAAFDVQVSTTQGEGWGLTTMEGMACGIPQILPDWSALGEWAKSAAYMVPCPTTLCTPGYINVVGGIPDRDAFIVALQELYESKERRGEHTRRGLDLVLRPEYRWDAIGQAFARELERASGHVTIGERGSFRVM